jgi:glutathione S-transferase
MLKIWGRRNSINVQKVMWCVHELGLAHERVDVGMAFGGNDQDWYLEMNPNGRIPTIDDDGVVLWESNVIVRYLASRYGAGSLCPADPAGRAQADKWMDWQHTTIMAGLHPIFIGLIRTPPEQRDQSAIDGGVAYASKAFGILNRQLDGQSFVQGESLTMADIPLGCAVYRWYALDVAHPDHPHLRAWYERLVERPAYRDHVMIPLS